MTLAQWYIFFGLMFCSVGLVRHLSDRSPVTPAMVYFAIGLIFGPLLLNKISLSFTENSHFLEYLTEFVVIVSVFASAMKLKLDAQNRSWGVILRLAVVSMTLTVVLVAVTSDFIFGLGLPLAILLGAILAPTDPVLASSVQVEDREDTDRLRQALTGEAGVNDSTAFPFVFLGLCLLGQREFGDFGEIWFLRDVLWGISAAVAIGCLCGFFAARAVSHAKDAGWENLVLDDFIAVGLMSASYGFSILAESYGFISVFAAGICFRYFFERSHSFLKKRKNSNLDGMIKFHEQLERFGEIFAVILLGVLVGTVRLRWEDFLFALALLFLIRPLAVYVGLYGTAALRQQKKVMAWMGIRGIGSLYYLTYSMNHGLDSGMAERLSAIVVAVLVLSLFLHGLTSHSIMSRYRKLMSK